MAETEITIGQDPVPSRDGSDYDPHSPQPTPAQVFVELTRAGIGAQDSFVIIAVGELGSPGGKISGISIVRDRNSIFNASVERGGTIAEKWSKLFGVSVPFKHVSSIVIRRI